MPDPAPIAAPAPAPAPTANEPWFTGIADADTIGQWTNRGWHTKTAPEVALAATKAWKEAEHFIGGSPENLLRVPADAADEAGWNKVWQRLGKPAEAKDYDFSTVKYADGSLPEEGFLNSMREAAFKLHLPNDAAAAVTREVVKYLDGADQSEMAGKQAKLAAEKGELMRNWGTNFEANKFIASRAAAALGVDPETVASLEGVVGYSKVMEMFRNIGSRIGEDKFFTGSNGGGNGVMTRDQAVARYNDLKADPVWLESYIKGDAAKAREMTALQRLMAG